MTERDVTVSPPIHRLVVTFNGRQHVVEGETRRDVVWKAFPVIGGQVVDSLTSFLRELEGIGDGDVWEWKFSIEATLKAAPGIELTEKGKEAVRQIRGEDRVH